MQQFPYPSLRTGLLLGLALVLLSGHAQAMQRNILVLGDSISAAYGMSLEQGWVAQMTDRIKAQHPDFAVVNASISGETSAGGLLRLPTLLQEHQPDLVIIELGANDGLRGYPLKTLRDNLSQLVTLSQQSGARVILLPMEIPPNYGARYTSGFRRSYSDVAADSDSVLAPFILDGVATRTELMQADGIHPTVEAQAMLLDNVLPTILDAVAGL